MAFKMPDIFQISVKGACPSHGRTDVSARQHTVLIDEPPSRGGTDLGASPLETLLASFAGCTNVIANLIAKEKGIEVHDMAIEVIGTLDTRGSRNVAEVSVPFPKIELKVDITTGASKSQVDELKTELAKRCPVSVIFRQAGSEITETWNIISP